MQRKNINKIVDLVEPDGSFKSYDELERTYRIKIDFMQHNSIKTAIPKSWLKKLKKSQPNNYTELNSENKVRINGKAKQITKITNREFYWEFLERNTENSKAVNTWEETYFLL